MSAHTRQTLPASLFPLVVTAALAALSYWLEITARIPLVVDAKSRHDPDYRVEDFAIWRHGPDGALQHTLHASFMQHFPDNDTAELTALRIIWHRAPQTVVTAQNARIDGEGKHVELFDDVIIRRSGSRDKADFVLATTRLDVYPDDEIATTREAVTLTQGTSNVRGVGLEVNNITGIAVLEGPVRGLFHRQHNTPAATALPVGENATFAARPQSRPKPQSKPKRKES